MTIAQILILNNATAFHLKTLGCQLSIIFSVWEMSSGVQHFFMEGRAPSTQPVATPLHHVDQHNFRVLLSCSKKSKSKKLTSGTITFSYCKEGSCLALISGLYALSSLLPRITSVMIVLVLPTVMFRS